MLNAAVRWEWIDSSPAKVAQRPRQPAPRPDPPSPDEAAKLVEKAFELDEEWGTLVWLVMRGGVRSILLPVPPLLESPGLPRYWLPLSRNGFAMPPTTSLNAHL
ncbi:hypothetical protein GCM10009676_39840 [Prauserella halophila]|uniref:Uncharacterized protein n=1 Tax=Prauserella halophila TaxID=185641 RepID=A0ABN1WGS8_9PSEU